MMVKVPDFPFEFPRGNPGPRQGLAPPHPASGRAPDIMDILESSKVANPGVDPLELIINLANTHSYGSMPGLQRTLLDQLAEAHTKALDIESRISPSFARMLMSDGGQLQPSIHDILDQGTEAPRMSSYFGGMTPSANGPQMNARVMEMLNRLGTLSPTAREAHGSTLLEGMAGKSPVGEAEDQVVSGAPPGPALANIRALLENLRSLTEQGGDPEQIGQRISGAVLGMPEPYGSNLSPSVMEALQTANIGSETPIAGADPASRRSLAPDMDPQGLANNMLAGAAEDQPNPDIELLLKLMGMTRADPRSNV